MPVIEGPRRPLRGIKLLYLQIIEDKQRAFNIQQIPLLGPAKPENLRPVGAARSPISDHPEKLEPG
jgi:hypothetical protein